MGGFQNQHPIYTTSHKHLPLRELPQEEMAGTPPARVGSKVNLRWLGNPSEGPSAQSSNKLKFCSDTPHQRPERARQNMNPGSFLEKEAGLVGKQRGKFPAGGKRLSGCSFGQVWERLPSTSHRYRPGLTVSGSSQRGWKSPAWCARPSPEAGTLLAGRAREEHAGAGRPPRPLQGVLPAEPRAAPPAGRLLLLLPPLGRGSGGAAAWALGSWGPPAQGIPRAFLGGLGTRVVAAASL